ncbi:hypothetical protein E4U35_007155 [Claviceps purpurea]|nr:hypothetical protein E4U12_001150 [Claviceps purpurea]KAG6137960.1 hypothetical protein E4U38_000776 [Claviceps purpurea]KAG6159261.1 hypothetical protein E4U37_004068 [Claviceps purpurea]KAG6163900.1 hypothetical protein E4U11_001593 [Claviceps purpurea]KAG6169792.1 hypothetical protein E4U51_001370 [Claviceps purpurea]
MNTVRNALRLQGLRAARVMPARNGACFSTSVRHGLKESSSQTDVDYDKHKQDSLAKQKKGTGHWKPELASDSEEAVRADRSSEEDFESLQERTKKAAEESRKAGTSAAEGV